MEWRQLGTSSLSISEISFGCMSLGTDDAYNARLIHRSIDAGINFFDTADIYREGLNEISLGKALSGKRSQVMIASKAGNQPRKDGKGWDWNPRKDYILSCADKSLSRLQTDYLDLYQLHGGTIDDPIDETIEAFELLQQQGKIRYYGISSIRPNVIREYVTRSHIASVMMQYSLLDRRPEEECLPLLRQNTIGVLARGSLASGLLARGLQGGKPAKAYLSYSENEVETMAKAVQSLSGPGRSAAQTALRFVLQQPAITSAVTGIRTMEQLEEVLATSATPKLSEKELELLRKAVVANRYEVHL